MKKKCAGEILNYGRELGLCLIINISSEMLQRGIDTKEGKHKQMKTCPFNSKEGRLGGGVKVKKGEKDRDHRSIILIHCI